MFHIGFQRAPRRRSAVVSRSLVIGTLVASAVVTFGTASAATTAASFTRADHPFLGNNHIVADFNGDGRLDLAGSGAQSAVVQLNNGTGSFGPRAEYPVATWAQDLAAGDFNGDGRVDLVVTINDRGPFIRGRVLDLSKGAARAIGLTGAGVGHVTAEVVS